MAVRLPSWLLPGGQTAGRQAAETACTALQAVHHRRGTGCLPRPVLAHGFFHSHPTGRSALQVVPTSLPILPPVGMVSQPRSALPPAADAGCPVRFLRR